MFKINNDIEIEVNGEKLGKQQILNLYQACIVENLLDDYSRVSGRFTDIHKLQEALLNQVKSNVKFSRDMVNALQIVEITNHDKTAKITILSQHKCHGRSGPDCRSPAHSQG